MMAPKKKQHVDRDLALWAKLGGGSLTPARELSEGERILAAGNEWVAEQLELQARAKATSRISPTIFLKQR
jgi:hypothetical protein